MTNKRGSFLEILQVLKSGKKGNLVVPSSIDLNRWEHFKRLLLNFLNGEDETRAPFSRREKFKSLPKNPTRKNIFSLFLFCGFLNLKSFQARHFVTSMRRVETGEKRVRKICWEDTLIVTKRDFHVDWSRILEALQVQTQCSFIINSFHPDNALLKCPD